MLRLLHIENVAVIEEAEILFERGFNVLTGETGAGKSIIIDAISVILGERAYRDMIRTGKNKATVRAIFDETPQLTWFENNAVPYEEELTIVREIHQDGRNVCRVNTVPVTVSALRKLGLQLINIHGQHDSAMLTDEAYHLSFLDGFAENEELRAKYQEEYRAYLALHDEVDKRFMDENEKARRLETLDYQIEEISRAKLTVGEDETLEARRKLLQNAEKLADGMHASVTALDGDDDVQGATELLSQAARSLERLCRYAPELTELHQTVSDLSYQVQDVAGQLKDHLDALAYSEDELEQIEQRLDLIRRLRRKYGNTCEDILQYLEKAKEEKERIEFADEHMAQLKKQEAEALEKAKKTALDLRTNRMYAALNLKGCILRELYMLNMRRVQFSCEFQPTALTQTGCDKVVFHMSANLGETPKPMNKIASGGEQARIMLALKNVFAEKDCVQTMIFDEVDTGVSGRAAQCVAEKLHELSKKRQVLCVTHLPQLAALADVHFLIDKEEHDGRTFTTVTRLEHEGRVRELARIIGGAEITETTLQSAEEMLNHA